MKLCYTGQRVIATSILFFDPEQYPEDHIWSYYPPTFTISNTIFLGLTALTDIIKEEVAPCIQLLRESHIRPILLTGDNPMTGLAIARKVGIVPEDELTIGEYAVKHNTPINLIGRQYNWETSGQALMRTGRAYCIQINSIVLTGEDILQYDITQWNELLLSYKYIVIGNILPQQKMDIVLHLQRLNRVVCLTGSGVNDAQALRQADVGVSHLHPLQVDGTLGIGSDGQQQEQNQDDDDAPIIPRSLYIAQDAATVLLKKNTLQTLTDGILTARENIDNCRKAIAYTTQKLMPELWLSTLFCCAFNVPGPLSTQCLTLIDCLIDIFCTLCFIYEPQEESQRKLPPRKLHKDHIVGWRQTVISFFFIGMWQTFVTCLVFIMHFQIHGVGWYDLYPKFHLFGTPDPIDPVTGLVIQSDLYLGLTLKQRNELWFEGKSITFITFVVQQALTAFSRRFLLESMFAKGIKNLFFGNIRLTIAVFITCFTPLIFTNTPAFCVFWSLHPINSVYGHLLAWGFGVGSALIQIAFSEWRKYMIRKHGPESKWRRFLEY